MSISPKQLGRFGTFYLQEAVLDTLYHHKLNSKYGLGAAEISRRADIYRERGIADIINDAIVTGILNSLHELNKVERAEQSTGKGGWKITQSEFEKRGEENS